MKNIISFLLLIVLMLILSLFYNYNNFLLDKPVYNVLLPQEKTLPSKVIDNYMSDDENLKTEAEKIIKTLTLKNLNLENWTQYIDYIDINLYLLDVIDDENKDLLIALNLSKDSGVIGIYKKSQEDYIFTNKIDDLTLIKDIFSIKAPNNNRHFIIINEYLDESIGSYFIDDFIRVYTLVDNNYKEVFRESIKSSGYFYEKWYNPSLENPKWFKISEDNVIDYLINENGDLIFNISKVILKFEGKGGIHDSVPEEFTLVTKKEFFISKYFSNEYNYFILDQGKSKTNNEDLGIIEDYNQTSDSLLNLSHNYYKVIDKNGKIDYVRKEQIIINRN